MPLIERGTADIDFRVNPGGLAQATAQIAALQRQVNLLRGGTGGGSGGGGSGGGGFGIADAFDTGRIARFAGMLATGTAAFGTMYGAATLVRDVVSGIVREGINIERIGITWKALLGSAVDANERISRIKTMGIELPFTFEEVNMAALHLSVINKYNEEALRTMADVGAAFDMSIAEVTNRFLSITRGRLQPIGRLGINKDEIAAEMGVAIHDVHMRTSAEIARVWDAALAVAKRKYDGFAEELMTSTSGQISNMKDAIQYAFVDIGKGITPEIKGVVGDLTARIRDGLADGTFERAGEALGRALNEALDRIDQAGRIGSRALGAVPDQVKHYVGRGASTILEWNQFAVIGKMMDLIEPKKRPVTMDPFDMWMHEQMWGGEAVYHKPPRDLSVSEEGSGGEGDPLRAWLDSQMALSAFMRGSKYEFPQVTGPERDKRLGKSRMYGAEMVAPEDFEVDMTSTQDFIADHWDEVLARMDTSTQVAYAGTLGAYRGLASSIGKIAEGMFLKDKHYKLTGLEITKYVAAQTLAATLQGIAGEATAQGGKEIAKAFASYPDAVGMAAHFAAAAAWFSLAGVSSGVGASMASGSTAGQGMIDANNRDEGRWGRGGGGHGDSSVSGGSASARILQAGSAPSTINYMVNVSYLGSVVYGDGGTRTWFFENIVPLMREARELGYLN